MKLDIGIKEAYISKTSINNTNIFLCALNSRITY